MSIYLHDDELRISSFDSRQKF